MRIRVDAYSVLDRLEVRMSFRAEDETGQTEHFSGYTRTFDFAEGEDLAATMAKVETAVRAYRGALTAARHTS